MLNVGSDETNNNNNGAGSTFVDSNTNSTTKSNTYLSPEEEAMQSLCKQLLKSRLFRCYYVERRFVQPLNSYRDIISLQRSEKELEKILLDMSNRLHLFYAHSSKPDMWIGITNGPLARTTPQTGALETHLWVELDELAFGQYWFSIKSIRFRHKEIILKLKMIREVEEDVPTSTFSTRKRLVTAPNIQQSQSTEISSTPSQFPINSSPSKTIVEEQIDFNDFVEIIRQWGMSIKQTIYDFMSQDINKENIKGTLRFLGILIFSIISGALVGIKFLGIFTLRFIYEFTRLTHVMTPIILKIIDVFNKIIGGFYILIAMIWRDTINKRAGGPPPHKMELEYNRPMYKAIKYDVRQKNQRNVQ